ncbi:profilin [Streptomyces sp. 3211]|uniref:profilin n=1 Tax=Streptomyces sp. 3211 TaxID=1964449 RepID=UPI0013315F94|nr:profilin [Streptomyces sp. 3211]
MKSDDVVQRPLERLKKGFDGAVVVKTKQTILVAAYKGPVQAPEVTPTVESLGDYLVGTGY